MQIIKMLNFIVMICFYKLIRILDYSVIGDAVNLAARLEAQTRNYKDENGKVTPTLYSSCTPWFYPQKFYRFSMILSINKTSKYVLSLD